jgi:serine protease Do
MTTRRIVFLIIVLALVVAGLLRLGQIVLRETTSRGTKAKPTAYTAAEGPKLEERDVPRLAAIDEEYTRLVGAVMPSVVSITSQRLTQPGASRTNPFDLLFGKSRGQQQVETSLGSGVIVSREGHVLTNNHVIEGMNAIVVQLADDRSFPAKLLGTDPTVDIAVLKIDAPNLEPLPVGDSDGVRVGQLVFAIGNPFGLSETVTAGIVSAKARRTSADSTVEYLQTDAAVNQGNSGGPLINLRGEIVGINTAIYSRKEDGGWLGISFAVPSNVARLALESVITKGRIMRGYLGVSLRGLTPDLAKRLKAGSTDGALVTDVVAGTPAERAGLKSGDVIRKFNGRAVKDVPGLKSQLREVDVGERVQLGVIRGGSEVKVEAQIGEAPPEPDGMPRR